MTLLDLVKERLPKEELCEHIPSCDRTEYKKQNQIDGRNLMLSQITQILDVPLSEVLEEEKIKHMIYTFWHNNGRGQKITQGQLERAYAEIAMFTTAIKNSDIWKPLKGA